MTSDANFQQIGQTVGAKLRAARLAKKFTQSQLALPDFSVSYVSAIERGQIHPSLRALEIFAQRLGLSSTDLLSKQTARESNELSDKEAVIERKDDIEIQLLEAQLFIYQGNAQQAVILLRNLTTSTLKSEHEIRLHYLLGWAYYQLGFLHESEAVLAEALLHADITKVFLAKQILNVLGMVHVSIHNHTQAVDFQQRILTQLEKDQQPHDAFFDAQIYTNVGLHYSNLDKLDKAIEMFQQALSITKEFHTVDQISSMYCDISRYLAETQQYFSALLYGQKSLQLLFGNHSDSLRSEIYYYLGRAMLLGDQQHTLIYLEGLLQDSAVKKDTLALASLSATFADALLRQGKVKKAREYAQKACELALPYGDGIITASTLIGLGKIAYDQRDYEEGDKQFAAGLDMLERLDTREELANQAALYAEMLEKRGLSNEALRFYKKAYENSRVHK